jgi:hypothetical protein
MKFAEVKETKYGWIVTTRYPNSHWMAGHVIESDPMPRAYAEMAARQHDQIMREWA